MKYFTKEWYKKMQSVSDWETLKVDERANEFSEDFFQNLYLELEEEWITKRQQVFDYLLDSDFYEEGMRFPLEEEKESFKEIFNHNIDCLEEKYPKEILDKVEDIRILALGHVSEEVFKLIKVFCDENKGFVEKAIGQYEEEFNSCFGEAKPNFLEKFDYHDCKVLAVEELNNDIVLKIEFDDASMDKTETIIFKDAFIEGDSIDDSIWLYNEFYNYDGRYEIHILTGKEYLMEAVIKFNDMILEDKTDVNEFV